MTPIESDRATGAPTLFERFLPDPVVGAMAGAALGLLAGINLDFWGIDMPSPIFLALGGLGGVLGCAAGLLRQGSPGRGRAVGWWCFTMTCIVGGISFLAGFVGPILLTPDSPQGPMLGIFITGPLGAIAGAVLGVVIGLTRPTSPIATATPRG